MSKNTYLVLAVVVFAGAGASYFYFNQTAQAAVDRHLERMVASGSYDKLEYEDFQVDIFGDIKMTNLLMSKAGQEVVLKDIAVTNLDYKNELPHTINVAVSGIHFPNGLPLTGGDPMSRYMQSLVVANDLPMEMEYSYEYDPDNAFQLDSRMNLQLPRSFTLDASGVLRNVKLESLMDTSGLDPDPAVAQLQMMQKLANAEIPVIKWTLKDEGLVDAVIAANAEETSQPVEAVREGMQSQLRDMYLFLPQSAQGFGMTTGIQLAAFLDGGKTLSVNLAPEYNGNFQQLQQEITGAAFTGNFARIAELLHLEILTQ
ncbi:MAG: hypothetical protein V4628_06565 [Pseudomonadota bacterium]